MGNNISVIIPAYNEENTIGSVISRIPKGYEIIVVDDCSTDATAWIARDHGVKVLKNKKNMGPEAGKQRAIDAASGGIIVTMDADGEHDPAEIPKLVNKLAMGYDMVLGERQSLPRLSERLMAWLVRRRVKGIRDATTGFRAAWKSRLKRIDMGKSVYGTNTILQMKRLGMNIASVPITQKPRRRQSRVRPLSIIRRMLILTFRVIFF